jgi:hypothetical protein
MSNSQVVNYVDTEKYNPSKILPEKNSVYQEKKILLALVRMTIQDGQH